MSDNLQLILRAVQEFDISVSRATELIEIDQKGEFNYDLLPYGAGTQAIFGFDEVPVQKYKELLAERDSLVRAIKIANKNLFDAQEAAKIITKQAIAAEAKRDALAAKLAELEGQEPVAWRWRRKGFEVWTIAATRPSDNVCFEDQPLYTQPVNAEEGVVQESSTWLR